MELQNLDQQLKLAIQNHQILVAKMKTDPTNGSLQKQLHELQAQIKGLSEKQKQVVQQLRKELEIKQKHAAIVTSNSVITTALPKANQNLIKVLPQSAPLSLTTKRPEVRPAKGITVSAAIILPNKVGIASSPSVVTTNGSNHTRPPLATATTNSATTTTSAIILRAVSTPTPLNAHLTPPIRVPQYPPSVGRGSSVQVNSHRSALPVSKDVTPQNLPQSVPHPVIQTAPSALSSPAVKQTTAEHVTCLSVPKDKPSSVDAMKTNFMAALGLITHDMLTELQSRRSERKRRTTANPQFSYGNWEHTDRKCNTNYLSGAMPTGFKRPRGRPRIGSSTTPTGSRPSTPEDTYHSFIQNGLPVTQNLRNGVLVESELCVICREKGDLDLVCEICSTACHRSCLDSEVKDGELHCPSSWICPRCLMIKKKNQEWPRSLTVVHSYISHKAEKEEEKQKLMKRGIELRSERSQLEQRVKQLSATLAQNVQRRKDLTARTNDTMGSINRIKKAIRVLRAS